MHVCYIYIYMYVCIHSISISDTVNFCNSHRMVSFLALWIQFLQFLGQLPGCTLILAVGKNRGNPWENHGENHGKI